jgi:multimeric flavodoxin WrbA
MVHQKTLEEDHRHKDGAPVSRTLLIVHHTPSPHCQEMFEAVLAGATDPDIEGVEVVRRAALTVSPTDMLEADGYLLGTPANLGYMSGALKHAFDVCYYPCLDATRGRPFGLYLHGNEGTEGAERGVDAITTGLCWVKAAGTVVVSGKPSKADIEACWELGATVAAQLME